MSEDQTPKMAQDVRIDRLFNLIQALVEDMHILKDEAEARKNNTRPNLAEKDSKSER